jgi:hypothetical protein
MRSADFDYSSILIKIDQLMRQVHHNILDRKFEENRPLIDEMLFQNRQLQLWNKDAQSAQRD